MAYTTNDLAADFKATWTADKIKEQMYYDESKGLKNILSTSNPIRSAMDLEIQGALNDQRQAAQRQMWTMPIHLDMSPNAVRMRKQRQVELQQRLASKKRGNKPSYRERQKNGRKAASR